MKRKKYNICVVGAGHVGLVAAAGFAELGNCVICVDNNQKKINQLNNLKIPFYEPQLPELVIKNFKEKRLKFSSHLNKSIKQSEVIFIAVGTPPLADGSADLGSVEKITRQIATNLNSYKLLVSKSTVPVQTGERIKQTILRYKKENAHFDVASNPEFLREGSAVKDFFYPQRIVLGVETKRAEKILKDIYSPLKAPIIVTGINTAELIKHACNSFLAMKISFINALARICDAAGADVRKIAEAMGKDKRIGREFLEAGIGYGGFCFPKDLEAFMYIAKKLGYNFSLLLEVKKINDEQQKYFVNKIKEHLWIIKDKKIAILGLSFKPNTDDLRFAPSLKVIELLQKEGANLCLYDPCALSEAKKIFKGKGIKFSKDPFSAAKNAECLCFLTEWEEFRKLDFLKIKKNLRYPLIADGRNMFSREEMEKLGFAYIGVGQ